MISSEKVEQFMEVARQLEYEESRNDREGSRDSDHDEDRERLRKGSSFERERRSESSRYAPYPSSRSERDRAKKSRRENRVYVSNLPFTMKWQELKDHMKKAGDVMFADILEDTQGRSKGCGIVEYVKEGDAQRAIKELADSDCGGRSLKIREDRVDNDERPHRRLRDNVRSSSSNGGGGGGSSSSLPTNLLGGLGGLGMVGLGQIGLLQKMSTKSDPLASTVFVKNLDYRITWGKLKDAFKPAGRVIRADVAEDSDGKSRGHGTVQFETPLEAINAVYMLNNKSLNDRTMHVRLDRESPYANLFGGQSGTSVTQTSNLANSLAGLAGLNPLALLQLQSMASLGGIAGLSGLAGLGGMNYSAGLTQQNTGLQSATAEASALTSAMNTAATANPYAAMLAATQGLTGQNYASQLYGTQTNTLASAFQSTSSAKGDPTKQVFVRNLPWKVSWQELKDKFREAGHVVRADVLMDDKQRSKGCGTVLFESADEAARAITLFNGTVMDGRQLEVRMDRG